MRINLVDQKITKPTKRMDKRCPCVMSESCGCDDQISRDLDLHDDDHA